jgi:hypothetical protein
MTPITHAIRRSAPQRWAAMLAAWLTLGEPASPGVQAAAPPQLDYLFPPGAAVGTNLQVEAGGQLGRELGALWADDPALVWTPTTNRTHFRLEVGPAARPGPHLVRFYTPDGASAPLLFVIGTEPETTETEDADLPCAPLPAFGAVANGRLRAPGEIDTWTVEVPGQRLLRARLVARTLDSPLVATLILRRDAGEGSVRSPPIPSQDPTLDCPVLVGTSLRLSVVATNTDISDLAGTVGSDARYRLHITTEALPPNPTSLTPVRNPPPAPDVFHRRAQPMPLTIPGTSRAYVSPPGRELYYTFDARRGERFQFLVRAGSIGSPLVPRLRVLDPNRTPQAEAPPAGDATLAWTATADGTFLLAIADATGRGGPGFTCQLVTEKPKAHFFARLDQDTVVLEPGQTRELLVHIDRPPSATALLSVTAIDLPQGVNVIPAHLPRGATEVRLTFQADPDAHPTNAPFRVLVLDPAGSPALAETARFPLLGRHTPPGGLLINDSDLVWVTVSSCAPHTQSGTSQP